jgi:hypothetical protein
VSLVETSLGSGLVLPGPSHACVTTVVVVDEMDMRGAWESSWTTTSDAIVISPSK